MYLLFKYEICLRLGTDEAGRYYNASLVEQAGNADLLRRQLWLQLSIAKQRGETQRQLEQLEKENQELMDIYSQTSDEMEDANFIPPSSLQVWSKDVTGCHWVWWDVTAITTIPSAIRWREVSWAVWMWPYKAPCNNSELWFSATKLLDEWPQHLHSTSITLEC